MLEDHLILCRDALSETERLISLGLIHDARDVMEEAKQHFFKVYWPLNGKTETGWVSLISYPGDAMNPPLEAPKQQLTNQSYRS